MTITYHLDENDYLNYQLYIASISERIKKKRQRSKTLTPIIYFIIGSLFFLQDKIVLTLFFCMIGILWFFIYPLWERSYYVKHYKSFIKENYKGRIHSKATLEFSDQYIIARDENSESKVATNKLDKICEIASTIYVMLNDGQTLILPKDKIENYNELRITLKALAHKLNINYDIEENWQWK